MKIRLLLPMLGLLGACPAMADDHVTIGTDWRAEAPHAGIYQALATGIYKKYHLDVTVVQGGPNLNQGQLLAAGRYDFDVQSNSFEPLNFVQNGVPIVAVAASFQKDPQVLIAHAGVGNDTLPQMKGKPIMISAESKDNFWQFLRAKYGFTDDQIRPYNYSVQPFLVNKQAVMQGYLTDEPFAIQIASGETPKVILLADQGYEGYAQFIATTAKTIETKPDLVQRFVDATMAGWQSYLHGDPTPAETAIKKDNPEMTDQILKLARAAIIAKGMVDSGDAKTLGLGAMTDKRWQDFFAMMSKQGVYPSDLAVKQAYTLRFVDHKAKP